MHGERVTQWKRSRGNSGRFTQGSRRSEGLVHNSTGLCPLGAACIAAVLPGPVVFAAQGRWRGRVARLGVGVLEPQRRGRGARAPRWERRSPGSHRASSQPACAARGTPPGARRGSEDTRTRALMKWQRCVWAGICKRLRSKLTQLSRPTVRS